MINRFSVIFLCVFFAAFLQSSYAEDMSTFRLEIDPLIGGGGAAHYVKYVIMESGDVYKYSGFFCVSPEGELIKKVDPKKIKDLREAIERADVWEMETGHPQYSGKRWDITIDGKIKTLYFISVPDNLKPAYQIVESIVCISPVKMRKKN